MPDSAWIPEAIMEFLRGPGYTNPLMSFIDERCLIFTPEEENKLEYTLIHEDFKTLVDKLLTDFLVELGVAPEDFFRIAVESQDKMTSFVVQTILTVDDFLLFKAMMVKRNMGLTNQVLNGVDELRRVAEVGLAGQALDEEDEDEQEDAPGLEEQLKLAMTMSTQDSEASSRAAALHNLMRSLQLQDEDVAMAAAIAESLKDAARIQSEMADLEQAIALSLALEAEQRRMALARAAGQLADEMNSLEGSAAAASANKAAGGGGGARTHQTFLNSEFPEPKPLSDLGSLPKLNLGAGNRHVGAAAGIDSLGAQQPATGSSKLSAAVAAAVGAASLLTAESAPSEASEGVCKAKLVPEPLNLQEKPSKELPEVTPKTRFIPAPLNLTGRPSADPPAAADAKQVPASPGAPAAQQASAHRPMGFKASTSMGKDQGAVREAAAAAAATQKNLISSQKAPAQADESDADAWLQDAKKRLIAQKQAERDAEMQAYTERRKAQQSAKPAFGSSSNLAAGEETEAKRAALRDKLAQKFKQSLMETPDAAQ